MNVETVFVTSLSRLNLSELSRSVVFRDFLNRLLATSFPSTYASLSNQHFEPSLVIDDIRLSNVDFVDDIFLDQYVFGSKTHCDHKFVLVDAVLLLTMRLDPLNDMSSAMKSFFTMIKDLIKLDLVVRVIDVSLIFGA